MREIPKDFNDLNHYTINEIAELWVPLNEVAKTDEKARSFLLIFGPWAEARLSSPS